MRDTMRELHQLRNEKKAHFRKLGAKTNEVDLEEGSASTRVTVRMTTRRRGLLLGQ